MKKEQAKKDAEKLLLELANSGHSVKLVKSNELYHVITGGICYDFPFDTLVKGDLCEMSWGDHLIFTGDYNFGGEPMFNTSVRQTRTKLNDFLCVDYRKTGFNVITGKMDDDRGTK